MFGMVLLEQNWNPFLQILSPMKKSCTNIIFKEWFYIYHINCGVIQGFPAPRKAVTTHVKKCRTFLFLFIYLFIYFFNVCWYSQSTTDTLLAFSATRSGWWMNCKVFTILNTSSQGARPNKNWCRSTHPTEKVWQLILIDQYLFFKIRYYVVPNCGTANEINGALYHDMALSMEMRLKQNFTSNFIFFHWSAPNPSGKMMIMYLPTIWVFTWYDSMSRDCRMTIFSSKSSLLCRSWHVSNPAETRVKVLFRLFILCGNGEIMYFRIMLKKNKKHLDV